jgi:putative membrane protein
LLKKLNPVKRSLKDYFVISLKGVAMGAADVVPGVSGGTIAFITEIYEELIASINQINFKTFKILKNDGLNAMWKSVNGNFLISLVLGIAISIISLAKIIRHLLDTQPILVWSFFFGLVFASIFYVAKQINKWNLIAITLLILGAILAFFITKLTPQTAEISYPYIFLSGALAICAMILPGISGSYILLLLGMYKPVLDAIHEKDIKILGTLIVGAVVGLLSFSRLLNWLFNHYKNLTLSILTGFIIGSLNKIWPWKNILESEMINGKLKILKEESISPFNFNGENQIYSAIVLAVIGFIFILFLEKLAVKKVN